MNAFWTWHPLGDLFEIGAGKTMSAAARSGPDKTPFLRTSNVLWDEVDISFIDEMSIPERELSNKLLRPGDMLVCEGGEIGRAAIWSGEVETMSFQNHLHRLRPVGEGVEPRFYVYFLQSAFTQLGIFEGAGNKTTIPNLSRSRLAGLEVPQPEIGEQRAIVTVLARVREAIKMHDQGVVLAQELKRVAMQTLFTCGLRGEAQKETEIGPLPESWEVVPLDALCTSTGSVDLRSEGSRKINYVDVSSISRDYLRIETTSSYILKEAPGRARKHILTGDIIFATVRPTLLRVAVVPDELNNQVCSTAFCVLRRDSKMTARNFTYYAVQRSQFVQQLAEIQTGASYPAVTDRMIKEQPIPLPSLQEQHEIVAILNTIDCKIDLHRRKRMVLENLFKALLYKLMTGKISTGQLDLPAVRKKREEHCRGTIPDLRDPDNTQYMLYLKNITEET